MVRLGPLGVTRIESKHGTLNLGTRRASKMEQGTRKLGENGTFDADLVDEKLGRKVEKLGKE